MLTSILHCTSLLLQTRETSSVTSHSNGKHTKHSGIQEGQKKPPPLATAASYLLRVKFRVVLTSNVSTSRISNHFSRQALSQLQFLSDLQIFNSRHLCNRGQRTSWDWRTWWASIFQACFHDRAVNKAINYSDFPKIRVVDNVNLGTRRILFTPRFN